MEFINKTLTLDCKGKTHSILVCEDHVPDSNNLKHHGMDDYSFIETCCSAEEGNKPEMEGRGKEDDDEVAEDSASFGAELACTKEKIQRNEPIDCQLGEEVDTIVEETAFEAGPMIRKGPYGKSILTQNSFSQYSSSASSSNLLLRKEKQKGKLKSQLEGFTSFARLHAFTIAVASKHSKSAIFRPAVATFAQSDLSEGVTPLNNYLLTEAKATLQLEKTLGINYNGEKDVVLNRIVDLELKDKERINKVGKAQQ
ncbi:hypothetical protein ACSBR1_003390 [Camellia fascicularis]